MYIIIELMNIQYKTPKYHLLSGHCSSIKSVIPIFLCFSSPNHEICPLSNWFPSALFLLPLLTCPDIFSLCQMRYVVRLIEQSAVCLFDS